MIARKSHFIGFALLAAGLLLTAACSAKNDTDGASVSAPASSSSTASAATTAAKPGALTQGKQYVSLATTAQRRGTGPVVVVEVFSYACPHCAEFAPYLDKLRAGLPKDVQVRYMPAVFSAAWEPYARAFYASQQLGVLDKTHDAVFQAMLQNYPLNSLDDLADFYASHGVDRAKFLDAANSPQTTAQMAADQKIEQTWGIDATPTLVVGRLQTDSPNAPVIADYRSADVASYAQLAQLGAYLVKKEQAAAPK